MLAIDRMVARQYSVPSLITRQTGFVARPSSVTLRRQSLQMNDTIVAFNSPSSRHGHRSQRLLETLVAAANWRKFSRLTLQ